MRKLFIVLAAFFALTSCNQNKHQISVIVRYGEGFANSGYTVIYCDSFQMLDTKTADIWRDGTKMRIYSETLITVGN